MFQMCHGTFGIKAVGAGFTDNVWQGTFNLTKPALDAKRR